MAKNALLGFIETRDTVLNSSAVSASSVAKSYSDNAGRKALAECMLYGRILHCIFAGSTMEENGRKMWIYPKFTVSSMLRMMDPEIFGCRVYLPNMIFVTDTDRSMRLYDRYLNDLGFDSVPAHHGKSYQKVIDDLERYEVSWRPSGRVKNVRIYGCFGHMRSVSRIPPDEFCSSSIGKYRHGTVFVCDESRKAEIIRAVRYGVRAEGLRNRIWRIVVILDPDLKGSRTYSSLDVTDGNIMEIGVYITRL